MLCSITSYHVTGVIFYDVASTVHWTLPLGSLTAWAAGTFEAGVDSGRHAEMSPFAALARCSAPHVYSDLPAASSPSSPLLSPPPAPPVSQLAARLTACVRDHIHEVTDLGGDIGVGAPMAGGSLSTSTRPTLNLLFFLLRFLHLLLLLLLLLLLRGGFEDKHSTDVQSPSPHPRFCTSIQTQGKPCSDLGRVLGLNDPAA